MNIVHMWRGKMEFEKYVDNDFVSIYRVDEGRVEHPELDGFIDIYIDDEITPSPFRDIEDAEYFADMIIKLLEAIT